MAKKVAIITDTNAGMSNEEAKKLGVSIVPMPFTINGESYFEGINLTVEEFYEKQESGADMSTSQPSPGDVMDKWDEALAAGYDEIVHIPMASGLSLSCGSAQGYAAGEDYAGKVFVVDNKRVSITLYQAILDAAELVKEGKSAAEIKEILEAQALDQLVLLTVDSLKYLKKGGRVSPAAAALGTVLNIKPILKFEGAQIDKHDKARGMKAARSVMIENLKSALEKGNLADLLKSGSLQLSVAYSKNDKEVLDSWIAQVKENFPGMSVYVGQLSLSVACHTGPGVLAVGVTRKYK